MVLAEYLQCGICFEPYTADSRLPKFLQCSGGIQHTYCLQCLRRLTVGGMIRCPCCGDLTSLGDRPADSLKNNIYLLPQIEAAAAARKQNGLEMFCRTCSAVAADQCGEHDLLKMSELREALRQLAERGAADMETVRQRRADAVTLFKEAHTVLVSVAESVRFTIEDYEMNAQLDDNIVGELERRREAADALPSDQLVDSYRFTEQHVADAHAALRETAPLAEQSAALLAASVALSAPGLSQTFAVGEWLHSGDLMKALLAASVVVYALDHVTAGEQEAGAAAEQCHKVGDTKPAAETKSFTYTNGLPAPSFSSMVKSTSPAAPAPAADAARTSVQRPLRGTNPRYSLRVTDGAAITDVIVELRPDMAPIMCKNFVTLCERGLLDNSRFHFAVHSDYLLGGRVDDDEGFSPLAKEPEKFVMADQCPLQDESGAIRMKGMGTVTGPNGEKRGLIGSQFMMWVSETRDYRQYQYTLVFGFIRQGLEFVRAITCMERAAIWRHARLLSTKPYRQ
ncbi:E3 ubiquitin-protein ligase TRIM32 [Amphibalanus amphitrite]|uniref:E3 ubiquitin-protein ligase TRIM32 n=1 Tax=Amphibalanus amphitrite TaxID=1232801 RepID=A0A6A4XG91_AMPAM|nr:E3 ubiquitin-protein ligase TRIM32 [Amphibalanus amphitrite]